MGCQFLFMNTTPIFDGHNDSLIHVFLPERGKGRSFLEESDIGQLDYPRAMQGGFRGGFFAIFTPAPKSSSEYGLSYEVSRDKKMFDEPLNSAIEYPYALDFTHAVFDLARRWEKESQGKLKIVRNFADLSWCFENNIMAMVLHIEGGAAIGEDLNNLETFFNRGLRSLGPVWSRPNVFGSGVPFWFPHSPNTGPGLTDKGMELVRACNHLGIIVDLAHMNDRGFWDTAKLSQHPLVVSHAGAHTLCPSARNLTDDQLKAIADSNGVVGIIFEPAGTRSDGAPCADSSLIEIVRHIDYVADTIGIDHVAFGSDFDGAPMPCDLTNASELPNLMTALRQAGYNEEQVEKLAYKNWFRVLKDTWPA